MCSLFRRLAFVAAVLSGSSFARSLTFCADPQNLPFSTQQQTGFDNKIASLIGAELGVSVKFYWARMGRGFVRNVVNKGECDALLGVPIGMRGLLTTAPYYRSSYMFVTRATDKQIESLDDPRLQSLSIGVQVLEDDYAPPARALSRRGLSKNVVGFDMDGDPGEIIAAVANKKVDTAIVWGPLAGYYAKKYGKRLRLTRVTPEIDPPMLPFTFSMAVGVKKSDPDLFHKVDDAVKRAAPRIQAILRQYNVPQLPIDARANRQVGALR
jgi:mxaJ protein